MPARRKGGQSTGCRATRHATACAELSLNHPSFYATDQSMPRSGASPRIPRSIPRPAHTCRHTCNCCDSNGIRWSGNSRKRVRRETERHRNGLGFESTWSSLVVEVVRRWGWRRIDASHDPSIAETNFHLTKPLDDNKGAGPRSSLRLRIRVYFE